MKKFIISAVKAGVYIIAFTGIIEGILFIGLTLWH